jgi:hypothetical protein
MLTGDTRQRQVQHLCQGHGCCSGPRDAAAIIADALVSGLVELLSNKLGSTSKFWTLEESLYSEAGMFMLHHLGVDCIPIAIGDVQVDVLDNDAVFEEDDAALFRKRNNIKARQAKEAASDPDHRLAVIQATWAGEPLEKANNELQHSEERGKCMLDATYSRGPIQECAAELFRRATSAPGTFFPLSFLVRHFDADADLDTFDVERGCFNKIAEIATQFWTRGSLPLSEPPWFFLQLLDARLSERELQALKTSIKARPLCDFDPACTRVVMEQAT